MAANQVPASSNSTIAGASIAVGCIAVAWVGLTFARHVRSAALSPELQVAIEAAASFARIFGALVLDLFAEQRNDRRMRWMVLALALLGISGLAFGYVLPATTGPLSYNTSIVISAYVWSVAAAFCRGRLPTDAAAVVSDSPFTKCLLITSLLLIPMLAWYAGTLPPVVDVASFEIAAKTDHTILRGLTALALAGVNRTPVPFGCWIDRCAAPSDP